jgi:hypothetical protein
MFETSPNATRAKAFEIDQISGDHAPIRADRPRGAPLPTMSSNETPARRTDTRRPDDLTPDLTPNDTSEAPARSAAEPAVPFGERERPVALTEERGPAADRFMPIQRVQEASPPRGATGLDAHAPTDPAFMPRVHVPGRLATQPTPENRETRRDARPDVRSAHLGPVVRDGVESTVPDVSLAPPPAVLVPRLLQPAQPVIPKPAEPVIHVTIGRVEIRAVSAPAGPERPKPSKPALSLSDYLHRRSGGGG